MFEKVMSADALRIIRVIRILKRQLQACTVNKENKKYKKYNKLIINKLHCLYFLFSIIKYCGLGCKRVVMVV